MPRRERKPLSDIAYGKNYLNLASTWCEDRCVNNTVDNFLAGTHAANAFRAASKDDNNTLAGRATSKHFIAQQILMESANRNHQGALDAGFARSEYRRKEKLEQKNRKN
jgi:hypothetical protein